MPAMYVQELPPRKGEESSMTMRAKRRPLLALVSLMALTLGLAPPGGARATGSDEPAGGHGRCGVSIYDDDPERPSSQWGPFGMAASPSGDVVYTTGRESVVGGGYNAVMVATSATGERLWVARIPSASFEAVAVSPDGSRVFVAGGIDTRNRGYWDFATAAYDAGTGEELWRDVFRDVEGDRRGQGWSVAVSPDGNRVYVAGALQQIDASQPLDDAVTIGYDAATGERQWLSVREPDKELAHWVAVSPDGQTVYVLGASNAAGSQSPPYSYYSHTTTFTVAYVARDPDDPAREGQELWSTVSDLGPPPGRSYDGGGPAGLALSPDGGRVYVTRSTGWGALSFDSRFYDWMTMAYDTATGEELWASRYRGPYGGSQATPGDNRPRAVVASPDGDNVFVTGWSADADQNQDFVIATVAYDTATGEERWVDRLPSPDYPVEGASDAAVSPDGATLYVTGNDIPNLFDDENGASRQTTVAYDTADGTRLSVVGFSDPTYNVYARSLVEVGGDGETVLVSGGVWSTERYQATGAGWDWFTAAYPVPLLSSIAVTGTTETEAAIEVAGTLCIDALARAPVVVATDPSGDAEVSGMGLDLGDATISTDVANRELVFTLKVHDGNAATGGIGPAMGYDWPVTVDGGGGLWWLGAGTTGSNLPPEAGKWWAVCLQQAALPCSGTSTTTRYVEGTMNRNQTTWRVPFARLAVPVEFGSTIEAGEAYQGAPASFLWPDVYVTPADAPVDITSTPVAYKVPGEVLIGIAPADVPESEVVFSSPGSFDPATGGFTGEVAVPSDPGEYRVWVKSCFGLVDSLTCVTDSTPLTI